MATLFLRNGRKTLVDIEISFYKDERDCHAAIIIDEYSKFLLNNLDRSDEIISDFSELSELRRWFWENYIEMTDRPSHDDCVRIVRDDLIRIAQKYDLNFVGD